jgi:hypothetical protein
MKNFQTNRKLLKITPNKSDLGASNIVHKALQMQKYLPLCCFILHKSKLMAITRASKAEATTKAASQSMEISPITEAHQTFYTIEDDCTQSRLPLHASFSRNSDSWSVASCSTPMVRNLTHPRLQTCRLIKAEVTTIFMRNFRMSFRIGGHEMKTYVVQASRWP